MIVQNNKVYKPIYADLAIFLVETSNFRVFHVTNTRMTLLDRSNYKSICKNFYENNEELTSLLVMEIGELPIFDISIRYDVNNRSTINIEPKDKLYNWLKWLNK